MPLIKKGDEILVDARLLHKMLKVGKDFRHWINDRIVDYGFKENEDFFRDANLAPGLKEPSLSNAHNRKKNGQKVEYTVTLEMAKELAMIERNEIGRMFRRYFIAKEKEAKALNIGASVDPSEVFGGIPSTTINGNMLYQFTPLMKQLGYSIRCGSKNRKDNYPNHFITIGHNIYVTTAYAIHLFKSALIVRSRKSVKAMQPVLGPDFGGSLQLK